MAAPTRILLWADQPAPYEAAIAAAGLDGRVAITTLKLGPVDTPMTTSHEKNAVFAQPRPVAEAIVRAMDARANEVYVPSFWSLIMLVVRHMPEAIFQKLAFLSGR